MCGSGWTTIFFGRCLPIVGPRQTAIESVQTGHRQLSRSITSAGQGFFQRFDTHVIDRLKHFIVSQRHNPTCQHPWHKEKRKEDFFFCFTPTNTEVKIRGRLPLRILLTKANQLLLMGASNNYGNAPIWDSKNQLSTLKQTNRNRNKRMNE
jgi:hypothetical protein